MSQRVSDEQLAKLSNFGNSEAITTDLADDLLDARERIKELLDRLGRAETNMRRLKSERDHFADVVTALRGELRAALEQP